MNFDDLLALAQHYEPVGSRIDPDALGANFAADWTLVQSMVPEPVSIFTCGLVAGVMRRRRD